MNGELSARPSWRTVFGAQFRLLTCSRRPHRLLLALVVVWALAEYLFVRVDAWAMPGLAVSPAWLLVHGLVGAAFALAVWRDPHRHARIHHWSMPVDVNVHDATRVAAGAAWLLLIIAGSLGLQVLLGLIHGHGALIGSATPVYWLAHFVVALICYLLVVPVSTLSGRPAEHIMIGLIVFYGLVALTAVGGVESVAFRLMERTMTAIFFGEYGLSTPFFGAKAVGATWDQTARLPAGYFGTWLLAALLWLGVGLAWLGGASLWVRRRLAE